MVAKEQKMKSIAFVVLLTISMISIIFYNYLFLLEALLYITINDYFTRTAMFLFCNLILLILAIDSGLLQKSSSVSSSTGLHDEFLMRKEENSKKIEEGKVIKAEKVINIVEGFVDDQEEEEEAHIIKEDDDEEKGGILQMIVVNDEMEHLEDEELEKRFEEFIEKVKKARRLEDMQLVMAS